jgi:Zn finger protein HypA/HybF involved in hydrogenase expression
MDTLSSWIGQYGLKEEEEGMYWGSAQGFPLVLSSTLQGQKIILKTWVYEPDQKGGLIEKLEEFKKTKDGLDYQIPMEQLTMSFSHTPANSKLLGELLEYLNTEKLQTCCHECGLRGQHPYFKRGQEIFPLCPDCEEKMGKALDQAQAEKANIPLKTIQGLAGAILGAIVGSLLWTVIGALGYIASLAGLAIAFTSYWGYTKFGGPKTKASVAIIIGTTLLGVLIGVVNVVVLSWFDAYQSADYSVTLWNIYYVLPDIFSIEEEVQAALSDSALGILFAAIGTYQFLKRINTSESAKIPTLVRLSSQNLLDRY